MANTQLPSNNTGHKWYEPLHDILATHMHMYACGPAYALSRSAMQKVFAEERETNRFFNIEDQAMGFWMMAHNVTYYDDRRMCANNCHASRFVAVNGLGPSCTGMRRPTVEIPRLQGLAACNAKPPAELPFVASNYPRFNNMTMAYRKRTIANARERNASK
jgi:hypothetical protein